MSDFHRINNMSTQYAKGTARRLAEQNYDQPRHYELADYDRLPTIDQVVEDMVDHGFDEATARASAQTLFDRLSDTSTEQDE